MYLFYQVFKTTVQNNDLNIKKNTSIEIKCLMWMKGNNWNIINV